MAEEEQDARRLSVAEIIKKRAELKAMLDEDYSQSVAVMFTDIKSSTGFFERYGDIAGREMIETHNRMLFPVIVSHEGHVIRTIGDAIMAYFESPEQSVRAAVAMQLALYRHNSEKPEEIDQIHIRIGIHFGVALLEYSEDGRVSDVYGDAVNTAARVESALDKQTDQILISQPIYEAVRDRDDIRVATCGAVELKNKAEPLEIYQVLWHPDEVAEEEAQPPGQGAGVEAPAEEVGMRHAVVVGISRYEDESIPDLKYAAKDAREFSEVLTAFGRFPADQVVLLTDEDGSLKNLKKALSDLRKAQPEDLVLVYFAGHGCPDVHFSDTGAADQLTWKYLVPYDAERENLYATGLPMDELQRLFGHLASQRVVVFLDSCYSGAGERSFSTVGARGTFSDALLEELSGEGRVVLAASDANELAFEADDLGHGVFTHFLMKGLQGEADPDGAGTVTLPQLYTYLSDRIPREASKLGGRQHPVLKGDPGSEFPLTFTQQPVQAAPSDPVAEAEALYKSGSYAEALEVLEAYLPEAGPRAPEVYCWIGKNRLASNALQQALEAYEAAVAQAPANPEGHAGRGQALLQTGAFDTAIEAFRNASEIDPEYRARFFEVQYRLEQELNQQPDNVQIYLNLARISSLQGKVRIAVEYALRAVELWPADRLADLENELEGIAFFELRKDFRYKTLIGAIEKRRAALEDYRQQFDRGESALSEADLSVAQEAFERCAEMDPDAAAPGEKLQEIARGREACRELVEEAREKLASGASESAREILDRALSLDRGDGDAISLQEEIAEAIRAEEQVQALLQAAGSLEDKGELEGARTELERARDLAPERADIQEGIERLQAQIQRQAARRELLAEVDTYASEGQLEEALMCLAQAAEHFPDDREIAEHRAALEVRLQGENLDRFRRSDLAGDLARRGLDAGRMVSREEIETALEEADYLPLDVAGAVSIVDEIYQKAQQARVHQGIRQARQLISEGNFAAARGQLDAVARMDPDASDLADLRTALNQGQTRQKALRDLLSASRQLMERQAYAEVKDRIQSQADLAAGNLEADRLLRQAMRRLQALEALQKVLDAVEVKIKEGKLSDALYHMLRIHARASEEIRLKDRARSYLETLYKRIRAEEAELKEELAEDIVLIPTGHFVMGNPQAGKDAWCQVFLDHYAIDRYPVTNQAYREFLAFMEAENDHRLCHPEEPRNKDHRPAGWDKLDAQDDNKPVVGIDWYDAYAYAAWAGKRLPTEAEWEKAGFWDPSAKRKRVYPWGNEFASIHCNTAGTQPGGPTPVGQFDTGASSYGLFDVLGNVWEWCADWYVTRPTKDSWIRNPEGSRFGAARVVRGGSWTDIQEEMAYGCRSRAFPGNKSDALGFRCAQSLKERSGKRET